MQHAELFETVHDRYLEGLVTCLDGMFTNFEDALFEIAYRGHDDARRARCFDLMRTLRQRRSALESAFLTELRNARQSAPGAVAAGRHPVAGDLSDDDERLALTISRKSRDHFSNLLEILRTRSEALAGRQFDAPDQLPFSPLNAARAFVRASELLGLDAGSRHILYQMFERYVMDRLGPLLGACNEALGEALAAVPGVDTRGAG